MMSKNYISDALIWLLEKIELNLFLKMLATKGIFFNTCCNLDTNQN